MSSQGELVAEEMVMDSEMKWGVWDWVCASSGCSSVFSLELGGSCGVVGLSSLQGGRDWTVGTCGSSYCCLIVRGAHIEVARCT